VERNADHFFVDVQDGVGALAVGRLGSRPNNMVIAGGNCSIFGFDQKGSEAFWTVTGDNVSSLALCDTHGKNSNSLLVGSDDFEIRVFQGEDMTEEITEADRVNLLHTVDGPMFAYGLSNGTLGVYTNTKTRLWRVKTKNKPTALLSYDIDLDGVPEIFSGWSHGAFNVRRQDNGEVIFRDTFDAPIASIIRSDYRMDGNEEVMICAEDGTINAYLPTDTEFGAMFDSGIAKENISDQKALDELHSTKLDLINELKNLERISKMSKTAELPPGALPPNTSLSYSIMPDLELKALALKVEVNTDIQIVNIIAVDLEGIILVEREVIAIAPKPQSKSAILPLKPNRNAGCKLRIQTHVATRSLGQQIHVFETDIEIPKFSAFTQVADLSQYSTPAGSVKFMVREPIDRFISWMNSSFILKNPIQSSSSTSEKFKIGFLSVCPTTNNDKIVSNPGNAANSRSTKKNNNFVTSADGELVILTFVKSSENNQTVTKVKLSCDNIDLAADIIQDFSKQFNWEELDSEADFPSDFEKFEEVILFNLLSFHLFCYKYEPCVYRC
jgi:Bardet-Biedl syndrome 2 protein